jgi:hypothetical protein
MAAHAAVTYARVAPLNIGPFPGGIRNRLVGESVTWWNPSCPKPTRKSALF